VREENLPSLRYYLWVLSLGRTLTEGLWVCMLCVPVLFCEESLFHQRTENMNELLLLCYASKTNEPSKASMGTWESQVHGTWTGTAGGLSKENDLSIE
jgi:hypothetical protein